MGTIVLLLLVSIAIPQVARSLSYQSEQGCASGNGLQAGLAFLNIHPDRVIIKPLSGQHKVYGVFVLPDEFQPGRMGWLEVAGAGYSKPQAVHRRGVRQSGIQAPPGHYVAKMFLQTREALGLILLGKLDKLKEPCNWTLRYSK